MGRLAREAIEQARDEVATAVGAYPSQVIFTSGGTEANNMVMQGISQLEEAGQIVISAIEHPCISQPANALTKRGWKVDVMPVKEDGQIDVEKTSGLLKQPVLISAMLANNETGVIQPVAELAQLARNAGAWMHTDAVQALGKLPVDFTELGVHALTLSAHKIGGPQGVGALVIDKRIDLPPLLMGGGQEKGLRSGTENVAGIVGFGMACRLATQQMDQRQRHLRSLREQLEIGLRALGATIFGLDAERLPNTSFFAFPRIDGETLLLALDRHGFAVASGSACSSDSTEPSHVLLAMGVEPELAKGAIRVSFGMSNTTEQVTDFINALQQELHRFNQYSAMAV